MLTGWAQTAEADFLDLDSAAFARSRATMLEAASCLDSPPIPADAASVHRVEALAAFLADNEDATRLSFHAMHEVDPNAKLPPEVALPGHRLTTLLHEAQALPPSPRVAGGLATPCSLSVDGMISSTLPADRPTLVVAQDARHQTLWSGLVAPGEALSVTCPTKIASPPDRRAWPLWVAAGSSAVVAGGFWSATQVTNARLEGYQQAVEADIDEEQLEPGAADISVMDDRRDIYGYTALSAAGLALGLGALAIGVTFTW